MLLARCIHHTNLATSGEELQWYYTPQEAEEFRDRFAVFLYRELLKWTVRKTNEALCPKEAYDDAVSLSIVFGLLWCGSLSVEI